MINPNSTHIVIDIETLDYTSTAIVTELSLVAFKLTEEGEESLGSIRAVFDPYEQHMAGRTLSPSTIGWHISKNRNNFLKYMSEEKNTAEELFKFVREFLSKIDSKNTYIWANSPSFDIIITNSLLETFNIEALPHFEYYKQRDYRTLAALLSKEELTALGEQFRKEGEAHNSLVDASFQAEVLKYIFKRITIQKD